MRLFGEKSCIQAIGMLLIDFTSLAPTTISATISLDVRPFDFDAARDRAPPSRLMSGLGSICAFVASIRIRPRQSIPFNPSGTFTQCLAYWTNCGTWDRPGRLGSWLQASSPRCGLSVLPALIHCWSLNDERPRVVFHRTSLLHGVICFTMHYQIQSG